MAWRSSYGAENISSVAAKKKRMAAGESVKSSEMAENQA